MWLERAESERERCKMRQGKRCKVRQEMSQFRSLQGMQAMGGAGFSSKCSLIHGKSFNLVSVGWWG